MLKNVSSNGLMERTKYFTPKEVSLHNTIKDLWVSYLGKVYDLTPLVEEHNGDVILKPIIECAGKDISHWFVPKKKDPWWKDSRYKVGLLSAKSRWIRIINTLTSQEQKLEVCSEETLDEILQRYLLYNTHASSYTWKHNGTNLDMTKTLSENGVPEEDEFYCGSPDCDLFSPSICLYFNDDLSEL
ncbi:hypothetical protein DNTS_028576 [Danionella cerebrum]|uniref:Cytochrome b5 domain-containing protein 1 n=1 Tax=Danionella cerebrum TaxID=2873325 RepID=A0A553QW77_9TELE|nr:hypothetical protein DNTS_028576 [Danionella translucida]